MPVWSARLAEWEVLAATRLVEAQGMLARLLRLAGVAIVPVARLQAIVADSVPQHTDNRVDQLRDLLGVVTWKCHSSPGKYAAFIMVACW